MERPGEKQNLVNFLRGMGIGFAPKEITDLEGNFKIQGVCIDNQNGQLKDKDYTHFLCGIGLTGVNLNNINLSFAVLEKAQAFNIKLKGANLSFADLQEANLGEAELEQANLINANLKDAKLSAANLRSAVLIGANFDTCKIYTGPH